MMEDTLSVAYAVAKALTEGKSLQELNRLQIALQAISSLVSAEVAERRLGSGIPLQTPSGTGK